ncbi:glutamine amidotransferase-related protein [Rhodospirillaceae bacterium SYSU D60014]|uniref:glutamine amidotransferase-related protein n=1 Tax=Virgifigura deserti TaxID=2268457 RepID=UPI0013C45267
MAGTILLIVHSANREGRVQPLLNSKGYEVEWRCPADGEGLPANPGRYAGVIVFGGVQSANDAPATPFLTQEIDWIHDYVAAGGRYLGICLGGQLLARALGARVAPHLQGLNEIGYFPITPAPAGRDLIPDPLHVYHWHQEGFELPEGAELLAAGKTFPNQAFRHGRSAYGFQFHPEVTPAVVRRWLESSPNHLTRPGAQPREMQLAYLERFDRPLHAWFDRFLDYWLRS